MCQGGKREKENTVMTISSRVTSCFEWREVWWFWSFSRYFIIFFFFNFFPPKLSRYMTWKLSWATEKHKRRRVYSWKKGKFFTFGRRWKFFAKCFSLLTTFVFFFSPFPLGIWPCFPLMSFDFHDEEWTKLLEYMSLRRYSKGKVNINSYPNTPRQVYFSRENADKSGDKENNR